MKLIFCRSNTPSSCAVSLLTLSVWSHVALVDGDHIVDAMWGHGVRRRTRQSFDAAFPRQVVVDVPCLNDAAGVRFALAQIGKRYDSSALWGVLLPGRRWNDADQWFCSELAAAALLAAGRPMPSDVSRITPAMLRDMTRPQSGPPPTPPR